MTDTRRRIFLLGIVIVAAVFRFYGLRWDDGLRGYPHPDERHLANTMTRVSLPWPPDLALLGDPDRSPLNPRRLIPGGNGEHYDLAYGTLPVYLYRATAVLLKALTGNPRFDEYYNYGLIGRAITAVFALLTLFWVYLLGRRVFDVPTGLLGAALLAVCVLHIQLAHFMTVDMMMSAMLTAGLLIGVRFARAGRRSDAFGMGFLLGLTMACKFNGITLVAGMAVAYGVVWLAGRRHLGELVFTCVPLTLLGWLLAFGTFEHYALRDPRTYAHAIGIQARMVTGRTDWPYTRQYVNTTPYLFQLENLVVWGMGWPLGLAAVGGALWATVEVASSFLRVHLGHGSNANVQLEQWFADPRWAGMLVLLGWAIPFFAYTARLEVKFLRYMLPLVPTLCLLAAHLLRVSGDALFRWKRVAMMRWLLPAVVLLSSLAWAVGYMRVYAHEHPWQAASRWFYRHAPPGSVYTWELWGDPLPANLPDEGLYRDDYGYRDVRMHIYYDMDPQDKLWHIASSLREADYVVLSTPRIYLSVARLPWRYPVEIRYYQLLFTEQLGYDLVARFTAFPGWGSVEVNDLGADQSFYDYDHPLVLIFRKRRDLSDREWQELFAEQLKSRPLATRHGREPPVALPIPLDSPIHQP